VDIGYSTNVTVVEASDAIGGISRTVTYKNFRCDIGGHRFFSKIEIVNDFWEDVLGEDFITVQRMSRIFYRGRFFQYPIKLGNVLWNLGIYESFRIGLSYVKWQLRPSRSEESMEEWVMNRFGGRLYMHFFRSYTEKVWGISGKAIRADWAAQRIKSLTLWGAVKNAFTNSSRETSLIDRFRYPRLGPGMMWERVRDRFVERGGTVVMQAPVTRLLRDGNRITGVEVTVQRDPASDRSETVRYAPGHVISSMPLRQLIESIEPPPPAPVLNAAEGLKYRDFLIVMLVLDHADPFPDNWIYVHAPEVKVGRIQNFRAWSADMVPEPGRASIGMEYFCQENDHLWDMADADLIALASRELEAIGLAPSKAVVDGTVIRQPKAYPVYDAEYRTHLDVIKDWVEGLENLQTIGRNGMHRYNNQDHSMLTGMFAAQNLVGADYDLWDVNTERSYHEEFVVENKRVVQDA
jgi:protoporphyrinogen oxidase